MKMDGKIEYQEFRKKFGFAVMEVLKKETADGLEWVDGYDSLFKYLNSDSKKGLLLMGAIGCGKTIAVLALRKAMYIRSQYTTCQDVSLQVSAKGAEAILEYSEAKRGHYSRSTENTWFFDDLGTEKVSNFYGTVYDPMQEILFSRHRHFVAFGLKTYATTNLSKEDLEKRYDARIFDRMKEMFEVVIFKNTKSLRK